MARKSILRGAKTAALAAVILLVLPASSFAKHASKPHETNNEAAGNARAFLWQNPADITSRDLYYGPGGKEHAPHTTYTFLKEDLNGTNPKFDVRDENGIKWKVKLGVEARPEVVASRLVWAVGYYANEDYFLPELRVEDMPPLKRGQNLVDPDGTVRNVRLKRHVRGREETRRLEMARKSVQPAARTERLAGDDGAHEQLGPQGREQLSLRREGKGCECS